MKKRSPNKSTRPSRAVTPVSTAVGTATPSDSAADSWWSRLSGWCGRHAYLSLTLAVTCCLLPFSGRAFHVDDTLFVWAAKQISAHPLDPYGFEITWDATRTPMSDVTQNPPLASYYLAVIARFAGWSERGLHIGVIFVAVALVLGTYQLATRFTKSPLLAALCTLLTPGVMVSAASVMCDTMMLALWVWAAWFWIEGLDSGKNWRLFVSSVLMGASALTKYFGVSIILLALAYSLFRERRVKVYLLCLAIPVAMLFGYEWWTDSVYGHGLLQTAAEFARSQRAASNGSPLSMLAVGLSFAGGCSLLGLVFAPLLWSYKQIAIGFIPAAILSCAVVTGWLDMGLHVGAPLAHPWFSGAQFLLFVIGGLSVLALAVKDLAVNRDPESLFLALWVGGTFFFAAFVNYTVNARSVLPLIPAAAILVARQFEATPGLTGRRRMQVTFALIASMAASLWITYADSELANSARQAAVMVIARTHGKGGKVFFEGHWGFQYYMESNGAEPLDFSNPQAQSGDFVAIPLNNIQTRSLEPSVVDSYQNVELPLHSAASTISSQLGAGFYSSYWGPLPFAFGPVPSEKYELVHLSFRSEKPTGR